MFHKFHQIPFRAYHNFFLISDVMEQRYKMERNAVDNLIRNQQRKLREQLKKTKQQLCAIQS